MMSMDEIYREHSKPIYRYLLSLTHDADASELQSLLESLGIK